MGRRSAVRFNFHNLIRRKAKTCGTDNAVDPLRAPMVLPTRGCGVCHTTIAISSTGAIPVYDAVAFGAGRSLMLISDVRV